jgi:geranylgeranyl pyrophosphate synthase
MPLDVNQVMPFVEDALAQVLPLHPTQEWVSKVGGSPRDPLPLSNIANINQPGIDLILRGGKRWRPLVMYLCYRMAGGEDFPWELGSLVELPHNGSLIIDDIEDHSEERRGKPAVHLIYGEDMAINSGNLLYFLPTYLLDELALSDHRYRLVVSAYLEVMRRLHFGQGLDIQWHNDHGFIPEIPTYIQMCRFKTGSLSSLAARLGVLLASENIELAWRAAEVWEDIGVGFQIMDDVKNLVTGNPGKMRGDDIIEGKKSLPVILHCQNSPDGGARLMALFQKVRENRQHPDLKNWIEEGISLMNASGSLLEARDWALRLLTKAQQKLEQVFTKSEWLDASFELINGFLQTFPQKDPTP